MALRNQDEPHLSRRNPRGKHIWILASLIFLLDNGRNDEGKNLFDHMYTELQLPMGLMGVRLGYMKNIYWLHLSFPWGLKNTLVVSFMTRKNWNNGLMNFWQNVSPPAYRIAENVKFWSQFGGSLISNTCCFVCLFCCSLHSNRQELQPIW